MTFVFKVSTRMARGIMVEIQVYVWGTYRRTISGAPHPTKVEPRHLAFQWTVVTIDLPSRFHVTLERVAILRFVSLGFRV